VEKATSKIPVENPKKHILLSPHPLCKTFSDFSRLFSRYPQFSGLLLRLLKKFILFFSERLYSCRQKKKRKEQAHEIFL